MKLNRKFKNKKLIVFDMDGTLTPSKSDLEPDMARLLIHLLKQRQVAVIGGGRYQQFRDQFLKKLPSRGDYLKKLFIFPTCSTAFYRHGHGAWQKVYSKMLTLKERRKIFSAFERVFKEIGYEHPPKTYGTIIEDRGSQVSFSALGQNIVGVLGAKRGIAAKAAWGKLPWRKKIAIEVQKQLPDFEVRRGGLSTIDVTRKGIDKAYGIRQIAKRLKIPVKDMLFVGDAIFPGGNDYAAVRTGVDYIKVTGPEETKRVIKFLIKN